MKSYAKSAIWQRRHRRIMSQVKRSFIPKFLFYPFVMRIYQDTFNLCFHILPLGCQIGMQVKSFSVIVRKIFEYNSVTVCQCSLRFRRIEQRHQFHDWKRTTWNNWLSNKARILYILLSLHDPVPWKLISYIHMKKLSFRVCD